MNDPACLVPGDYDETEFSTDACVDDTPFELSLDDLIAVDPSIVRSGAGRNFDLYTRLGGRIALFRCADEPLDERAVDVMKKRGGRALFVLRSERDKYLRFVERSMLAVLVDPSIPVRERATALYDMSITVIDDLAKNPDAKRSMTRSRSLVTGITGFIHCAPQGLQALFLNRRIDGDVATRAVNCCVFAIALTERLGITDADDVQALGLGCLLKDIGMLLIPKRVVNKPGELSPQEWMIVKRHPDLAMKLVEKSGDAVAPITAEAILQHHERLDGTGYPQGLSGDAVGLAGRVAAVVDIFDALTTDRPHARAMPTFAALQRMRGELGAGIDREVFRHLVMLLSV